MKGTKEGLEDIVLTIHCSVCGAETASFHVGPNPYNGEECLIYSGLTHVGYLSKKHAAKAFEYLESGDTAKLHELLKKKYTHEGLDSYCPDCNAIYCREHYHLHEEFDEGFYDCTRGTCPSGHERMVDD